MSVFGAKITGSQKAAFGGLAVALAALGVNYLFFSGEPKSASAAEVKSPDGEPSAVNIPVAKSSAGSVETENGLSKALLQLNEKIEASTTIRDAFKPSTAWLADVSIAAVHRGFDPMIAKAFSDSHQVKLIFKNANGGQAIVNGRLVHPGDVLDGFRLETVANNYVRFSSNLTFVDLHISGNIGDSELGVNP